MIKSLSKKELIIRSIFIICVGIISLLFVRRLFFGMDVTDESFNLCESYRLASGNRLLVDIWDYYQLGDMFLTPFIWIYVSIKGSTEGIVLACRLFYLCINIGIGLIAYWAVKDYIFNFYAKISVSLAIVFYAPFSLYYLWYDTAAQLFFLLGILFLLKAFKNSRIIWYIMGGLFHACMVVAYPSAIAVIVVEFVCCLVLCIRNKRKRNAGFYFLGGMIPVIGILIYGFIVRFDFYLFNNPVSNVKQTEETTGVVTGLQLESFSKLFGRGADSIGDKLFTSLKSIVSSFFSGKVVLFILVVGSALFIIYLLRRKGMEKILTFLYLSLVVAVIVISLKSSGEYNRAVIFLYFICIVLLIGGFIIYPHLIKKYAYIILLVVIPSVVFVPVMSITTSHAGNKAVMGLWVLCLFSLGIYLDNIPNIAMKIKDIFAPLFVVGFLTLDVYLFYGQFFQDTCQYSELTIRADEGIYKGLYVSEEDVHYLNLEKEIVSLVNDNMCNIAIFDDKNSFKYLAINGRVKIYNILEAVKYERGTYYYAAFKTYWERFGYPDALLVNKSDDWYIEQDIYDTPGCKYVRDRESEHYILFRNMVN